MLAPHDEEEEEDIFGLIKAGDTQGVCQLLDADHELLDSRDDHQRTPLMVAAIQGRADLLEALMQRGPDLEATDLDGWRALHHAAGTFRWGQQAANEAPRLLIQGGADVMARTTEGITALMLAAKFSKVVIAVSLLERMHGTGIDWRDGEGRTALHWASQRADCELAAILLHAGADHTVADMEGTTPLMAAKSRPSWWWSSGSIKGLLEVSQ
jgi:ankyrin repeat protein